MSPAISAALLLLPLALAQQCEEQALLQHKSSELQLYGDFLEGNSTRKKCKNCVCEFLGDVAKCGEKTITDGAKCGWHEVKCAWVWVKHAAECITKPSKCKVKKCTKVPKTCKKGLSCFKQMDFGDCLKELSGRGSLENVAVKALKTAGTLEPKKLKKKVHDGLEWVLEKLEKFLGKKVFPEVMKDLKKWGAYDMLKSFWSEAEKAYNEASGLVTSFVNGFESFFKKAKTGSFKLPRNKDGEFCAMKWDLTMFWFDDCGFFDAQQGLTKHIAKSYNPAMWGTFVKDYKKMGEALVKCATLSTKLPVTKDVTLKISTPFMTLQKMDFCMPKVVTAAAEVTTNAIIDLKKHAPDAFKDLKEAADKLADYAKELFSSKPSLLQRGNMSLFQLKEVSNKSGIEGLTESFMCSKKKNSEGYVAWKDYAFLIRIQMSFGVQLKKWSSAGLKEAHAIGGGIFFGCKDMKFQVVPFMNLRWVSMGISFPPSSKNGFFKKAKTGSFKLPRNKDGEFCAMNWDLTMFWFDDCGFFDALDGLTKHIAKSYNPAMWGTFGKDYKKMGEALVKCAMLSTKLPVTKDVTLKISTPFMTLQKMDFCMPKVVTAAAEVTTNAIIDLKKHAPDAFKDLKEAADKLADYAKELFSSEPSLLQRGNMSLFQLKEVSNKSGIEGLTESFMCSKKKNSEGYVAWKDYAFLIRIQMSFGVQLKKWTSAGLKEAHAIGGGIFFGCKDMKFQVVPFMNIRWVSMGIGFPESSKNGVLSVGADIQIKYYREYPCFPSYGHFKTGAAFQVQAGLTSETKKFKGTIRSSVSMWSPDITSSNVDDWTPKAPEAPHGIGFSIGMKLSSLAQASAWIRPNCWSGSWPRWTRNRRSFRLELSTCAYSNTIASLLIAYASADAQVVSGPGTWPGFAQGGSIIPGQRAGLDHKGMAMSYASTHS